MPTMKNRNASNKSNRFAPYHKRKATNYDFRLINSRHLKIRLVDDGKGECNNMYKQDPFLGNYGFSSKPEELAAHGPTFSEKNIIKGGRHRKVEYKNFQSKKDRVPLYNKDKATNSGRTLSKSRNLNFGIADDGKDDWNNWDKEDPIMEKYGFSSKPEKLDDKVHTNSKQNLTKRNNYREAEYQELNVGHVNFTPSSVPNVDSSSCIRETRVIVANGRRMREETTTSKAAKSARPVRVAWYIVTDTSFLYNVDLALLQKVVEAKKGRYHIVVPLATMEEIDRHGRKVAHLRNQATEVTKTLGVLLLADLATLQLPADEIQDVDPFLRSHDIRIMACAKRLMKLYPNCVACASDDKAMVMELRAALPVVNSWDFSRNKGDMDLAVVFEGDI